MKLAQKRTLSLILTMAIILLASSFCAINNIAPSYIAEKNNVQTFEFEELQRCSGTQFAHEVVNIFLNNVLNY